MHLPRLCLPLVVAWSSWLAVPAAAENRCDEAIRFATTLVERGREGAESENIYASRDVVADARIIAIDAAQRAKACGCTEAIPPLAGAAEDAARVNLAINLTAIKQYGAAVAKQGEKALVVLRRCAGQ